jgi:large subunit ribosomal protein L24
MEKKFSTAWKSSTQPRKQRKYRFNAPLHVKKSFMHSHLAKELRQKYKLRSAGLKTGDKVKIMRGQFKGKTGKVERIDIKKTKVYITGIDIIKKDGSKTFFSFNPSNLLITELNLDDKKRQQVLDKKKATKGGP